MSYLTDLLEKEGNARKKQLFTIACAQRVIHQLPERAKNVLNTAYRLADRLASQRQMNKAYDYVRQFERNCQLYSSKYFAARCLMQIIIIEANTEVCAVNYVLLATDNAEKEKQYHWTIFHDIFDPVPHNIPTNPLIINLAQIMYETNDFTDMPILHDMLLELNANDHILDHLKTKTHIRGCWIIDTILGKS